MSSAQTGVLAGSTGKERTYEPSDWRCGFASGPLKFCQ